MPPGLSDSGLVFAPSRRAVVPVEALVMDFVEHVGVSLVDLVELIPCLLGGFLESKGHVMQPSGLLAARRDGVHPGGLQGDRWWAVAKGRPATGAGDSHDPVEAVTRHCGERCGAVELGDASGEL